MPLPALPPTPPAPRPCGHECPRPSHSDRWLLPTRLLGRRPQPAHHVAISFPPQLPGLTATPHGEVGEVPRRRGCPGILDHLGPGRGPKGARAPAGTRRALLALEAVGMAAEAVREAEAQQDTEEAGVGDEWALAAGKVSVEDDGVAQAEQDERLQELPQAEPVPRPDICHAGGCSGSAPLSGFPSLQGLLVAQAQEESEVELSPVWKKGHRPGHPWLLGPGGILHPAGWLWWQWRRRGKTAAAEQGQSQGQESCGDGPAPATMGPSLPAVGTPPQQDTPPQQWPHPSNAQPRVVLEWVCAGQEWPLGRRAGDGMRPVQACLNRDHSTPNTLLGVTEHVSTLSTPSEAQAHPAQGRYCKEKILWVHGADGESTHPLPCPAQPV